MGLSKHDWRSHLRRINKSLHGCVPRLQKSPMVCSASCLFPREIQIWKNDVTRLGTERIRAALPSFQILCITIFLYMKFNQSKIILKQCLKKRSPLLVKQRYLKFFIFFFNYIFSKFLLSLFLPTPPKKRYIWQWNFTVSQFSFLKKDKLCRNVLRIFSCF